MIHQGITLYPFIYIFGGIHIQEGIGITEILNAIVERIPPPPETADKPFRALIFDRFALIPRRQKHRV